MFSLQDARRRAAALDGKALRTMLDRTFAWDGSKLDVSRAFTDAGACLGWDPPHIDAVTAGFATIAGRLLDGFPPRERRAAADPPAQAPWVRAAATGLSFCPEVEAEAEVRGADLSDLIRRDVLSRVVALYAGRCKDGALDARLLIGSFGFFLISRVVDGLRRKVRQLPPAEADRLLRAFAPMLVIIARMQEEQAERKDELKDATTKLQAEIDDAQAERARAEAALRLRKGAAKPADLRTLTEPPGPPRKGRRTKR